VSVYTDLEAAIESNATAISGYAAALAADSIDPLESYSLDGENVSRESWRAGLADMISKLNEQTNELRKTLNRMRPFVISTRQVL
jgi:hypothetical protein